MSIRLIGVCAFLSVLAAVCLAAYAPSPAEEVPPATSPTAENRATSPVDARAEPSDSDGSQSSLSPELKIREALRSRVDFELVETPLAEVLASLEDELGVQIRVDQAALDDANISSDIRATFPGSGVSAGAALDAMLFDLDLTWAIRHEVLYISTPEEAELWLTTRIYDVSDLLGGPGGFDPNFDSITELFTTCIEPNMWEDVGGPGTCAPYQVEGVTALVISQRRDVHEGIETLLKDLRRVRREVPSEEGTATARGVQPDAIPSSEEAILRVLDRQVTVEYSETPLVDAVRHLHDTQRIPIWLDRKALDDIGVDPEATVTCRVSEVTLRSALELMLKPLGLTWTVRSEMLWITTTEEEEVLLRVKVYDVSDLYCHRSEYGGPIVDYESLIALIISTIRPGSWDDVGGPGAVAPFGVPGIHAIVVSQSWRVLREIDSLLDQLRKLPRRTEPQPLPVEPPEPAAQQPEAELLVPLQRDDARDALVRGNNQFAFELYGRIRGDSRENLILSPYSVVSAMAMAHAGARGETAEEMAECLHFTLPPEQMHAGFTSLRELFEGAPEERGYQLHVANRLWGQRGYGFLDTFLATTRNQFGAELAEVDFAKPAEASQTINDWVSEQTAQKIREIVSPELINPQLTRLILTNAVYFKGDWDSPFQQASTQPAPFFAGTRKIEAAMMHQQERFRYAAADDLQILEMPYVGRELSMVVLLPKLRPNALADLQQKLTAENVNRWLSGLNARKVEVYLPKFKFESQFRLTDVLRSMGMRLAFEPAAADLSGMNGGKERLWLEFVIHKAFVDVNEKGTEAAAATAGGSFGGMMPPPPIPVFRADHPFVFFIRDLRSGTLLFLGRVMEPESFEAAGGALEGPFGPNPFQ